MNDVFTQLVEASGLSPLFAEHALSRAIQRAGQDPGELTAEGLRECLSEVERTIEAFLSGQDLGSALERVAALVDG